MLQRGAMRKKIIRVSKFMSSVLRHKPELIGLSVDHAGWVEVDELLFRASQAGVALNRKLLEQVMRQNNKQRFSFSDDGLRIRANYGHSIPVDLGLASLAPPDTLFHGTATRFLEAIKRKGLVSRQRNYVHLSSEQQTAINVGRRHGRPTVLTVEAGRMYARGFEFLYSADGVWLTEKVPVEHIIFPVS
jgi:putative RNA 2'-phosphotransferase